MKRILFILLFLPMLPLAVCAAVKIGDIYYNLNSSDKTAELVYQRNHTYSGDVVIPSSVTYGDVEYSVTGIRGNAFWRSSELTSVTIPSSVTSIGRCAFTQCTELTYISIPNSVTSIGYCAFTDCWKLGTVILGNALTNIGEGAFLRSNLTDMYCYAEQMPELDGIVFLYSNYNATLHVPAGSLEAYSNAEQWKDFKEIVALTDSDPTPTGIKGVNNNVKTDERYYSLDGKYTTTPQRGLNIIRMSNGTTKKIVMPK